MAKKLLISVFLFSLLIPIGIMAQSTGVLKGFIKDSKSGEALSNASVYVSDAKTGTFSTFNGSFKIENLSIGSHKIEIRYLGYTTLQQEVTIKSGENTIDFLMQMDIKQILGVEIKNDQIQNRSYSKVTIKKFEIEESSVRDLGDLMRMIPNVQAVRKGGANLDPVVRGFKFDQLNIQLDQGMTIEGGCPNRMDPTTSHVEAEDIEAIEVLKGPFALRYGPVMGGVVNLITINPRPFEKFEIHVKANTGYESNWNGNRQHITVLGGGQKVFFAFTANNSFYKDFEDGNGVTVPSQFRKFGGSGKLGVALAKNHIITASYSEFYARNMFFPTLPMDERTDNTKLYSFDYKGRNISKVVESIDFKLYYTDVDHTMDNLERSLADTSAGIAHILATRLGYRAEAGLKVLKGHMFVGTDFYKIDKDGDRVKNMIGQMPNALGIIPVKYEDLWNKAVINNYGFFAEYTRKTGKWEYIGALRLDLNSAESDSILLKNTSGASILRIVPDSTTSNFTNFSASLGVTRMISEKFSIGASVGRGVRSPNMLERFTIQLPVGLDNFEYLGNPLLKPEANNEFDLIFKYNDFKLGAFELTGFYSYVQDYINGVYLPKTIVMPLTPTVYGVKKFENIGDATLYGFEFGYKSPSQYKLKGGLTAAYTMGLHADSVYTFDAAGNATSRTYVENDPLSEIPPLNINAFISYDLFKGVLIPKFSFRYIAEQNKISKAQFELPSESFSLINFSLTYKQSKELTIVGGVTNLLDQAYYEHLNRRILGTDIRLNEPGRVFYVNLIFNL